MDFNLTERQLSLQKTAREFGKNEVTPIARNLDKMNDPTQAVFPLSLYKRANEIGIIKLLLPKRYGGSEASFLDYIVLMEELSAADPGFAIAVNGICTNILPIINYGSEEQRNACLKGMADEDMALISIGGGEPDVPSSEDRLGHLFPDPKFGIKTLAKPVSNGYIINGIKSALITLEGLTRYFLVMARTDMTKPAFENISLFLVSASNPGLIIKKTAKKPTGLIGTQSVELHFNDCFIPKEALIGEEGNARECLSPISLVGIATIGAMSVGVAGAAYEYALSHAKNRLVGGEPLIKYQAVAMTLVDMKMEIEAARLLVWNAACSDNFQCSAIAKVYATEMAVRVTQKAFEVLGRIGMTTESPAEKYMRDAVMINISGGSGTIWRLLTGETL